MQEKAKVKLAARLYALHNAGDLNLDDCIRAADSVFADLYAVDRARWIRKAEKIPEILAAVAREVDRP